jgi:hypothetical protein
MNPIHIPDEWDNRALLTFEQFCDLICTPQRTVRDWRRRGVGPRWARFDGCGRLYVTVAEARRFIRSAAPAAAGHAAGRRPTECSRG